MGSASAQQQTFVLEPNQYSYTFDVPDGWKYSLDEARRVGVRLMLLPPGESFGSSPAVIYVNEIDCGGGDVVECVVERFRPGNPDLRVTPVSPVPTKSGATARVILLDGASDPHQAREALAFLEEEETTVLVVLSTKDLASWTEDLRAFETVVRGFEYFTCPNPSLAIPCSTATEKP